MKIRIHHDSVLFLIYDFYEEYNLLLQFLRSVILAWESKLEIERSKFIREKYFHRGENHYE